MTTKGGVSASARSRSSWKTGLGVLAVIVLLGVLAFILGRPLRDWLAGGPQSPADERGGEAQLPAEVDDLVEARTADLESQMRAEMDQELEAMRKRLEEAQKAASEREQLDGESAPEVDAATPPLVGETEGAEGATPSTDPRQTDTPTAEAHRADEPRSGEPRADQPRRSAAGGQVRRPADATPGRIRRDSVRRDPDRRDPGRRQADLRPGPRPIPRPLPKVGSAVSRQSASPRLISNLRPRFPAEAGGDRGTQLLIPVRVRIDERGRVVTATLKRQVGAAFDQEALRVARNAAFMPATEAGRPKPSSVTLLIHFRR